MGHTQIMVLVNQVRNSYLPCLLFRTRSWLGTMTNRSVVTVAHNGLKSKQARKNSELVFGWNHELRMTPKVINFNQKDYAKVPKDFCIVSFGYVLKYC